MQYVWFLLAIILLIVWIGQALLYALAAVVGLFIIVFVALFIYNFILELAEMRNNKRTSKNPILSKRELKEIEQLTKQFKQITNKFGSNIIVEDKFANIFNDYFPDDRQRISLLRSAISLGALEDILKKKGSNRIINVVENHTQTLVNSGYDENDAKVMLYSIAKLSGLYISTNGEIIPTRSKFYRLITPILQKQWIFLILPLIGLLLCFGIRYCYEAKLINLLATYLLTIFAYIATFVIPWLYFDKKRENPLLGGLFVGVNIAGIILYFISPWLCDILMRFYGIDFENYYLKENSQTIYIIILYVIGIIGGLLLSGTETTRLSSTGGTEVNPKILGGLFASIAVSMVLFFASYHIVSWITEIKDSITSSMLHSSRKDEIKALSFNNIQLGSDIHDCIYKIQSIDNNYSVSSDLEMVPISLRNKFLLDDNSSLIDSIVAIKTQDWEEVIFCVSKGSIVSIVCKPDFLTAHDLLNVYSIKYGAPEHKHSHISEYYSDDCPYIWNYKNCQIVLEKTNYGYYGKNECVVYYIDNSFKELVVRNNTIYHEVQDSLKLEHEKAIKIEEQKREQERIQAEKEQRIKENERTKRTLEQI